MAYQKRLEQDNYNAWLQGMYIQNAISSFLNKQNKYPSSPYSNNTNVEFESSGEAQFLNWIDAYNSKFDKEN